MKLYQRVIDIALEYHRMLIILFVRNKYNKECDTQKKLIHFNFVEYCIVERMENCNMIKLNYNQERSRQYGYL